MAELKGKVVVVTGGSAGVGRAAAQAFAGQGAKVAVLARGLERLASAVQQLKQIGSPETISVQVDVAVPDQVENAAQEIEEKLGPIEIWVNDAMTTVFAPFKQLTGGPRARVCNCGRRNASAGTKGSPQSSSSCSQ